MSEQDGHRQHISGQFNAELEAATTHMLEMGGLVKKQVLRAVAAFGDRDSGDAQAVVDSDSSINAMELSIDGECFRILARRQPAAGDLRLVLAISKVVVDLERIGDEASRIARQAISLSEQAVENVAHPWTQRMARIVTGMLQGALDAFARRDAAAALAIARGDEAIDAELHGAIAALADSMRAAPDRVDAAITSMWALRSLQRVGDHARNIAEYVVYMVEGVDVRHAELDNVSSWLPGRGN